MQKRVTIFKITVCLILCTFISVCPSLELDNDQSIAFNTDEGEQTYSECPKKGPYNYLLYKEDGKCYRANSKGPCNHNMILYPHPTLGAKFGFCECIDAREETRQELEFLNDRNLSHCIGPEIRGQIYVPELDGCYPVFAQGPCPPGKWLVLNSTFYPVCAQNTCEYSKFRIRVPSTTPTYDLDDPTSPKYVFTLSSYSSECYETMSRGYCPKSYELRFSSNHFLPQCRYVTPEYSRKPCPPPVPEIRTLKCKPGSRYDYLTKCSRLISPR